MRAWLMCLLLTAACHEAGDRPLEPVWGKQPCDHCAMLLDEPRFAAQAVTADGTRVYFDDVGCLAGWLDEHPATARAWVRAGDAWVPAAQARFASGARTPMGYGYVAATSAPVTPAGPVTIDWSELRARLGAHAAAAHLEDAHAH
jgi:hypothetical protein